MRRRILHALTILSLAALVACGSQGDAGPAVAELDFAVPALDGGQVEGAALAGKDVALWFWAPW